MMIVEMAVFALIVRYKAKFWPDFSNKYSEWGLIITENWIKGRAQRNLRWIKSVINEKVFSWPITTGSKIFNSLKGHFAIYKRQARVSKAGQCYIVCPFNKKKLYAQ